MLLFRPMKTQYQPTDWREGRRLRAWELHQLGWQQKDIALALGVTPGAVSQWMARGHAGGVAALRNRKSPGAPVRLSAAQRQDIPALLAKGAEAWGFRGDIWTRARVAAVIKREFGVAYHPDHVGRLLRDLGWTVQKPLERASQRDEQAIAAWHEQKWPEIKNQAEQEGRTLVWIDEAGFYLVPSVVRTYAPCGQTPILRAPLSYDHVSAISAITPDGQLLMQMQETAYQGTDVVRFLKHVLRQIAGKVLIVWDGAPIHQGQAIKEFLAAGGSKRIHLERLPGYAPELNPDEGIWRYLKHEELKNVVCQNCTELRVELGLATARLRQKRHVIQSCIKHAGLIL
jgi:transposase